jgi:hypothetical protein
MLKLYTYCIPCDDGAAPNPYWGTCTLTICKPAIRRTAQIGDWIVGTGSKHSPIGDITGKVVYAMRVTKVMTMQEYDNWTAENLTGKIPDSNSPDVRRKLGDSIYDFSTKQPTQRTGVHGSGNIATDLGGMNALLSDHFFYFGNSPQQLPSNLLGIIHHTQGHRVQLNQPFVANFIEWLNSLRLKLNQLYGQPAFEIFDATGSCGGACARREASESDACVDLEKPKQK